MKKIAFALTVAAVLGVFVGTSVAADQPETEAAASGRGLRAVLRGFQEPPALVSAATGVFKAKVSPDLTTIEYQLTYADFDTQVLFSHIHIGLRGVNGGIAIFLCGGGGQADCPQGGGTVNGTITADNVMGISDQDLQAGDLASVLKAIRNGAAYVNVHTRKHPPGEIRGQIVVGRARRGEKEQSED